MKIEEYQKAYRAFWWRAIPAILVIAGLAAACFLFLSVGPGGKWFEPVQKFGDPLASLVPILSIFGSTAAVVLLGVWLVGRLEKKLGLNCPECQRSLSSHYSLVVATRNCPHCGKTIIEADAD